VENYKELLRENHRKNSFKGSFDEFCEILTKIYRIERMREPAGENQEIHFRCSCTGFWKSWVCKHALAWSIYSRLTTVPPRESITTVGKRGKRGRPKQATEALVLEDRRSKKQKGGSETMVCNFDADTICRGVEVDIFTEGQENSENREIVHEARTESNLVQSTCGGTLGSLYCAYPICKGFGERFENGKRGHHRCSHPRCNLFLHAVCYTEYWTKILEKESQKSLTPRQIFGVFVTLFEKRVLTDRECANKN